jgi:hypothetical protein
MRTEAFHEAGTSDVSRQKSQPVVKDADYGIVGDVPPRIPEGDYVVAFVRDERGRFQGRDRWFLWFRIVRPESWSGTQLYLVCPCPSKGGKRFGLGSKMIAAATVALGQRPKRRDRLSSRMFRNKYFLARVRTVRRDARGNKRMQEDQYSVIDELRAVEAGG